MCIIKLFMFSAHKVTGRNRVRPNIFPKIIFMQLDINSPGGGGWGL